MRQIFELILEIYQETMRSIFLEQRELKRLSSTGPWMVGVEAPALTLDPWVL